MQRFCRFGIWALLLLAPGVSRASLFFSADLSANLLTYDAVGNLLFTTPLIVSPGTAILSLAVQPGTGTLFGAADAPGSTSLVSIDPNTGAVTDLGTMFSAAGSAPGSVASATVSTGLAFTADGNLYVGAIGSAGGGVICGAGNIIDCSGSLYSVNPLDGAVSLIGGVDVGGALAGASGLVLYNGDGTVNSIDPSDGSATQLAHLSFPTSYSFTVGPAGLYYLIDSSGNLDTLDGSFSLTTGPALAGSPRPGVLAFSPGVTGFTPEPASLGLLGAGIAGLVAFRKYLR